MTSPEHRESDRRSVVVYALSQFVIAYVTLAIVNYTPAFYASEVGIPMLAISGLMLLSRGVDVVTAPLIALLSDRTRSRLGRRKPWLLAGTPVLMLGAWGVVAAVTLRTLALGALLMLPMAIIADVIDRDTAQTGSQRTGIYMAVGGIVVKFAVSLCVATALAIPGLFGFDATAAENPTDARFALMAAYAWLHAVFFLAAARLFWHFPLGRERVAQAQAALR